MTEPEKTDDYCTCKPEEFPHGRRERYMTNVPRCVLCFKPDPPTSERER